MPEGTITFGAQHAPAHWDDKMRHVLLSARVSEVGGFGAMSVSKEVSPAEAREYAAQIIAACEIVESESDPERREQS